MPRVDLAWRALTPSDATEMADVATAVATADRVVRGTSTARDFTEAFESAGRPATPVFIGAFADGRLAAFGMLSAGTAADPVHRIAFAGGVHPDFRRRGIGTELVRHAVAEAPALHAAAFPDAPLELYIYARDDVPGQAELAAATGLTPWRHSLTMSRALTRQDPAKLRAPLPEGLELVGFAPGYVERLRAAHNASFVPDHPGQTPATAQMWANRFTKPNFRPELSFLLLDARADAVAGYLLANEHAPEPGDRARNAHLTTICTQRGYRSRGVASALIGAALAEAARQGYGVASLVVDADNPSGAVAVYQRAGFRTARRATTYVRKIAV